MKYTTSASLCKEKSGALPGKISAVLLAKLPIEVQHLLSYTGYSTFEKYGAVPVVKGVYMNDKYEEIYSRVPKPN